MTELIRQAFRARKSKALKRPIDGETVSILTRLATQECAEGTPLDQTWELLCGWNNQMQSPLPSDHVERLLKEVADRGSSMVVPEERAIGDLSQLESVWTLEQDLEWLVDDLIAEKSVTLLSAGSGTGKSWLAYFIAGRVASGQDVLGKAVRQSKVVYVDGENPLSVAKRNLTDLGIERSDELLVWGGWNDPEPKRPDHPLVLDFVEKHKPLVIYDSLVEFHPGDEQSSTETRRFMKHFRKLANLGGSVLILHHTGKAESSKEYRGSSDIKAAVDTALLLKTETLREGKLGELSLTCFKGRLAPIPNLGLEFRVGEGFLPTEAPSSTDEVTQALEMVTSLVEQNPGANQSHLVALVRAQGLSRNKADNALKTGGFRVEDGPNNSKLYYPAEQQSPTDCLSDEVQIADYANASA